MVFVYDQPRASLFAKTQGQTKPALWRRLEFVPGSAAKQDKGKRNVAVRDDTDLDGLEHRP